MIASWLSFFDIGKYDYDPCAKEGYTHLNCRERRNCRLVKNDKEKANEEQYYSCK